MECAWDMLCPRRTSACLQVLLKDDQLRRCFVLHLMAAWESGLLDSDGVDAALRASKGLDQLGAAVP